ncbi:hypothetical protein [Desulfatitalea alkaliphila]|uniref:Uncharacterized protein n=1 Tax=Desulfatitalea alkaliphila TaxID=2929485 RepID=A0AA41UKQ8_9BACT|nr:hypothetical protein [Desulfatitalea alkaliphila]MCJ8501687.1 hypothetical protein [Desulfatitalea alkaliphila]
MEPVPGGVYLCQVNETVSCGACCGLYNVADPSRANLNRLLTRRTETFATLPRTVAAMDDFSHRVQDRECDKRPFPDFHHCPFIGLIGPRRSRVGCLLHPLAEGNNGIDWRGLSFYGGLACHSYFCPATRTLPARYKQLLRLVAQDWYLYGMVVTEADLVAAMLQWIEQRTGTLLEPSRAMGRPEARRRLTELLDLKLDWPFRPSGHDTPCHNFFSDPPHRRPSIDYRGLGVAPSPLDTMLRELVCAFDTPADLRHAELLLQDRLTAAARALMDAPTASPNAMKAKTR